MMADNYTVDDQFVGKERVVREIYEALLGALRPLGAVVEEPKKSSIHLANGSGFAGVHTRKDYLNLNLVSSTPIESPRVNKLEQVSKNRYHNLIRLDSAADVDEELQGWLKSAYERPK